MYLFIILKCTMVYMVCINQKVAKVKQPLIPSNIPVYWLRLYALMCIEWCIYHKHLTELLNDEPQYCTSVIATLIAIPIVESPIVIICLGICNVLVVIWCCIVYCCHSKEGPIRIENQGSARRNKTMVQTIVNKYICDAHFVVLW